MGLPPASSFLRRLVARQREPLPQDPADLGTAFGLEASLGPVSTYPTEAEGADPANRDEAPMGWLGRRPKRTG